MIGTRKCEGLIGLRNFSGADFGLKFVGITKKTERMLTWPLMKMILL